MHLISLMRILKQILCWSHLLLLAIFVCISMIPVAVICEANNETHTVTGNMSVFVTNASILNNNKTKEQVPTKQHSVNRYIYISIAVGILLMFCFTRQGRFIVKVITLTVINIIWDSFYKLRRLISYVFNIRNVFTPFRLIARPAAPVPVVPQNHLQVRYENRDNGENDAVIFNLPQPPEYD
ncbi:uncharacterized protein LOC114931401 [Nylanderia fulva]|uniref:uncharacterized protein LOC114931401 n=1 Tax=Nylanderia fulva TaxID=613905 RepID=UPI0010FAF23F|nr:uncharacterized protein LOC114931401 [Nylanderia fulva]